MDGQGDPPNTEHRVEGARCFIHGRHRAIHLCCPARAASIILPSQAILGLGSAFLPHHPGPSPLLGWGHSFWLEVKAGSHASTTTEHSGKLRFQEVRGPHGSWGLFLPFQAGGGARGTSGGRQRPRSHGASRLPGSWSCPHLSLGRRWAGSPCANPGQSASTHALRLPGPTHT